MLTFDIKKNQDYCCRQTVIVEVAKYLKTNYEMIALSNWRFDYDLNRGDSIGERVAQIYTFPYVENLNRFHNLELKSYKIKDNEDIKKFILSNIEMGNPVIVHSDTFYCPWYVGYYKIHYSHFYIIIGIHGENYQCYDPTMCDCMVEENQATLLEGIDEVIIIERKKEHECTSHEYLTVVQEDITKYVNDSFENNMYRFGNDIVEEFNPEIEFDPYREYIDTAPLIDNVRDIFVFRIGYAKMLKYVSEITSLKEITELYEEMNECSDIWRTIRGRIIKMALGRKYDKDRRNDLKQCIRDICTKELNLAEKIMKVTI